MNLRAVHLRRSNIGGKSGVLSLDDFDKGKGVGLKIKKISDVLNEEAEYGNKVLLIFDIWTKIKLYHIKFWGTCSKTKSTTDQQTNTS